MTVYVDDMRLRARVGRLSARWSHLTADTTSELHDFAAGIGLRRAWFQDKPGGRWHYDVTDTKRAQALTADAQPVGYRDMPQIMRRPGREGATASTVPTTAATTQEGRP